MHMKQKSVYQQTQALLCKNLLKKWRMKRQSLLEWGFPILLGFYMGIFSYLKENVHFPEMPPQDLGRVDKFNSSSMDVVYTPISNITQEIMNKTACAPFLKGRRVIGAPDQKYMDKILLDNFPYTVGVIFNDTFSYKLKFYQGYYIPILKEDLFTAHCWGADNEFSCSLAKYWSRGFVTLQTAINAAIIQITTNHYVMEELMSVTAINMKTLPFIFKENLQNEMFIFYCLLYFSPFIYFLSLNVTKERKKYKDLMKMMGLQDSAFWLSWGLIYAGFIFITSIIIAIIIISTQIIVMTGFMVIFTLFFLYGLSLIALAFLMTVLLKKTILTSLLVFVLTLFWGGVGFTAFYRQLPSPLEWIFSICSPFAFTAGINQVQRILLELDIQNIQNNIATHLSEGQKRKLTIGIAILGDPQVLLLDEPTVGLDPFSRHRVWSFLKEHKADRVILLSTNFMDEADILADRKVILSSGRVKCAGSSVFLKRRWGLGYHLSLYRNETCDPEKITSLINHHIPDAKLKTESKEKLVYTLPVERTNKFPDLFSDLDKGSGLGVMGYDVSTSTLNEVFMKLEGTSTAEQEMMGDTGRLPEMDPPCSSLPEMQTAVSAMGLWRLQFCAMARLRFLKLKHGKKAFLTLLFVFGIAMFPLIVESILYAVLNQKTDWDFKPELYFLSPGQLPQDPRTSLLIINNTESNIEDFIQSLKHQNILLEVDDFENRNGTDDPAYNGAIIVSGKKRDYRFSVVCNTKRLHCFPTLMNIVSNGLLQMLNHTQYIRTERSSFPFNYALFWTGLPEGSFFLFFVVCSISPYIAMNSVSDYKKRTKSQLWISGLFPSAYWCGQALVDVNLYNFILLSTYSVFYAANMVHIHLASRAVLALAVITLGYAVSLVFLTYVISFIFRKRRKNSGLWSFCFYMTAVITFGIIIINQFDFRVLMVCMVLVPSMTLGGFIGFLEERAHKYQIKYQDPNYDLNASDLLVCLIPYFQALLFIFVLRCLEIKCGKKIMQKDPVFRISPKSRDGRPNPEEPVDEDEDVQAERMRTATALTISTEEKPVIIASCLHKEYAGQKKRCFSRRKKKIAARNVSFCVKKGEILGLLGPNGAGKSSSIRMISGVMKPTAGEVELTGYGSVLGHQGDGSVRFLGYCPQENVLWPILTAREHLEVFAAVKGLRKADASVAISRLADAFKLHEQLNVPVQKLTAGATRKLCFVLSILGDPPVLLLDEPSTGLDPTEQQHMWQTIQAAIKNTERGALLTTHYLAEAEAVCDRVAMMVSGRLRCIGSIQHLKNHLGKEYILELTVKETSQVPLVHTEVLKLFPHAAQQERCSSFLAYKLPTEDVRPLSQAFHKLEAVKHNFNLEEYSLSQCTLEKVSLELSKEQELGNFDEEVDTTMRWKLLPHSEDP
ncbi:ATP-binding cassette sub-family A member 6 isoform X2 [Eschrichtius robustus]|uniref:ATP-binding cassette sub-family A member 6 isoform X2 n=1 Tax=Eschrichtius robustus TaxID=9764 RepID=UPI0035BEF9E7